MNVAASNAKRSQRARPRGETTASALHSARSADGPREAMTEPAHQPPPARCTEAKGAARRDCDDMFFSSLRRELLELLVTIRDLRGLASTDEGDADRLLQEADHTYAEACVDLVRLEESLDDMREQLAAHGVHDEAPWDVLRPRISRKVARDDA